MEKVAAEEMANRYKWLGVDATCVKDTEEMKLTTLFLDLKSLSLLKIKCGNL